MPISVCQSDRLNHFHLTDGTGNAYGIAEGVLLIDPETGTPYNAAHSYVWNTDTLAWIKDTGGGAGGGGAATIADGADVAEGATTDVAWVSGAGTVVSLLKKIVEGIGVTGTFWRATQPVSGSVTVNLGLTDTQLRATAVPVSGTLTVNTGLTDAQLRAAPVPITVDAAALAALETTTANQGVAGNSDWRTDQRRGATLLFAAINASAGGDNTLVAADGTKKIKVLQYTMVAGGTVNATFKSGAGTSLTGAMPLVVNSGIASPFVAPAAGHLLETAVNQALVLNLSGAIAVTGHLTYILET